MPISNEDLRVRKTQAAIKNAFLTLLDKKLFKDITVKEITQAAPCNRNTFYLHYTDKYDLMEKLCASQLSATKKVLCATYGKQYPSNLDWCVDISRIILDAIESDIQFYEVVFGKNRYPDFADQYQKLLADFIDTSLDKAAKSKRSHFEVQFSASGMIGLLKYWIVNREIYAKEQIAEEMYRFVVKVGGVLFE